MISFISGEIIALLTFPGVIIHEAAHRFFCDIFGVPVYEVCYFAPFSKKSGYVLHEPSNNVKANFFIATGPFFINTLVCILFAFPHIAASRITGIDDTIASANYLYAFLVWIGISAGVWAIPSSTDIELLFPEIKKNFKENRSYIFPLFLLYLLKVLNFFRIFSLFYGIGLACAVPFILL